MCVYPEEQTASVIMLPDVSLINKLFLYSSYIRKTCKNVLVLASPQHKPQIQAY
jgi:hypothetical protein